jgi:LPS sulfotransferase NodH
MTTLDYAAPSRTNMRASTRGHVNGNHSAAPHPVSYLVCATPRTGSSLLCDLLTATGVAGRPDEYFTDNPRGALHDPTWMSDRRSLPTSEYLQKLNEYGATENGVFGGKITAQQLLSLSRALPQDERGQDTTATALKDSFPNLKFIWMTRRNKVEQAVSLCRAVQTGAFISHNGAQPKVRSRYSFALIDYSLDQILLQDQIWTYFFSANNIHPLTVTYEDLAAEPEMILQRVCEYLGVYHEGLGLVSREGKVELRKAAASEQAAVDELANRAHRQGDASSASWVRRYHGRKRLQRRMRILAGLPVIFRNPHARNWYWVRFRNDPHLPWE